MGLPKAVDPQYPCRFYHVNSYTDAISRFTTIFVNLGHSLFTMDIVTFKLFSKGLTFPIEADTKRSFSLGGAISSIDGSFTYHLMDI